MPLLTTIVRSAIVEGTMPVKLSAELSDELEKKDSGELLDVILELRKDSQPATAQTVGSRSEKIAALKEAFERNRAPVEEIVRKVGGEVTGSAWINQTVRARVPAKKVKELAEHEKIIAVDIPHPLTPDSSS